jgi:putative protein-disulfide isomerase
LQKKLFRMNPILIYCYDAYCGWCYGFSPVMKRIAADFKDRLEIEVLSGGMMTGNNKMPIEKIGPYIQSAYKRVEEITGIKFGEDFLWHTANPDKSDWLMNSEKPAIALCIFKEYYPGQQLDFASDLQYALNYEGRDLDDDEAYRHLLEKYELPVEEFYSKLKAGNYKEKAYYEFALCRQLNVDSFPQVLIQLGETKFFLIAKGFTAYEDVKERVEKVLSENSDLNSQ